MRHLPIPIRLLIVMLRKYNSQLILLLLLGTTSGQVSARTVATELKTIPHIVAPYLSDKKAIFDSNNMRGTTWVIIMWASWAKKSEWKNNWKYLLKASEKYKPIMYGVNYRDTEGAAISYLSKNGDPFNKSIVDVDGKIGIELEVYGIPEIFVVSKTGDLLYRHKGTLKARDWENLIEPKINNDTK